MRVHLVSCPNHAYVREVRVGLHVVGRKLEMSIIMAHLVSVPPMSSIMQSVSSAASEGGLLPNQFMSPIMSSSTNLHSS